jgi:hypothetical protein
MLFSDEFRAYDDFTKRMLIIAVVVVLASCVLFGHALWQVRWHDAYSAESAPLTPSFTSTSVLLSGVLTIVILGVAYGAYYALTMSDFRQTCQREGNEWRQSYPTRNFETVSSNSVIGCFVHDGHYHFIDEREYRSYMDSL